METPFPAASSSRLADGVVVQPRKFEFQDLASVPQYWFANNSILTHFENAFSILIPPGERFFIRSVRAYRDQVRDPELKELVRAFSQQEGLHMRAHNELNASFSAFGVDVDRETAASERVFKWLETYLPKRVKLGMTAFLEHITATGAHSLFTHPLVAESMHPKMLEFWKWHAIEELEHKSVAFDVFQETGGGYFSRVLSVIPAVVVLLFYLNRIALRMIRDDPNKPSAETRREARRFQAKVVGPQLPLILDYFRPSFHPRDFDDARYITEWYQSAEAA